MRVTAIEIFELEATPTVPWRIATTIFAKLYATVVRLWTDGGLSGIGECIVRVGPGVTGRAVEEILAPVVLGRDPLDVEAIWDDMYRTLRYKGHSRGFLLEAMSGIDIAIWDLLGKRFGLPTSRALHGCGRTGLQTYASSILLDKPEEMAGQAQKLVAQGFQTIKMKVGEGLDIDVARIAAVRAAVGPDVQLMLDANSGYDAATAAAVARDAERLGVYWLEEPVPPDDVTGYRRLRGATGLRIAAGESEFTASGLVPLIHERLIDVVQPDIARAGGFTGCRRIAAVADAYNLPIAPHTGASGAICIAASLHLGAALSNFLIFEHMFLANPLQCILSPALPEPTAGIIEVPDRPGLGFELDETGIRPFVRGTRTVAAK